MPVKATFHQPTYLFCPVPIVNTPKITNMKILLLTAALFLAGRPAPSLIVVDKNLKKPLLEKQGFTMQDYLQHSFPIYATDREAVIEGLDKAARWVDTTTGKPRTDTLYTAHTAIAVSMHNSEPRCFSVVLVTAIDESRTSFSFAVVTREENKRKAQQRILNLGAYLDQ